MIQVLAQVVSLLLFIVYQTLLAIAYLPWFIVNNCFISFSNRNSKPGECTPDVLPSAVFFEGTVNHIRRKPKTNTFRYNVRTCYINLDKPPGWFKGQASDHMTAAEARSYAGTDGPVWLLTNPAAAGYAINPISVYYCHSSSGTLSKCIAEVTNTPWNERVTFVFLPQSKDRIKKALHVSPLMDMKATWQLEAPQPGSTLKLVVRVNHPVHGDFFYADLVARRCEGPYASCRNEEAGWGTLLRYGFQSHRIAVWIYWQALVLLWKGLPMYSPPPWATLQAAGQGASHPTNQITCCPFTWRPAASGWPWDTWGMKSVQLSE